jgi:uncharacterized membrane protein YgcG
MNLEMPSPAETDSLRTILLIVLGVMILTIPVVFVIVLAKVTAQRKQQPGNGSRKPGVSSHDSASPNLIMGAGHYAAGAVDSGQVEVPPPFPPGVEPSPGLPHEKGQDSQAPPGEPSSGFLDSSPSWGSGSPSMDSGGGSFDGGGDSGGGGGGE